jgi:hypothetical protein
MQIAKDSTDIPLTLAHEETGSARESISPAAPLERNTFLLQSWFALLFLLELSRCRGAARGRLKREDCRASSGWVRALLGACQNKWTAMSLKTRISPDCRHGSTFLDVTEFVDIPRPDIHSASHSAVRAVSISDAGIGMSQPMLPN